MFKTLIKRYRRTLWLYTVIGLACAVLSALSVWWFQQLVDVLTARDTAARLITLLALYGTATFLVLALNYLEEYPDNRLRHGLYQTIKQLALQKASGIDYTAYQDLGTGRLIQLVDHGAAAGRDILFGFYLQVITRLAPEAVLSIALMGLYDVRIMLAALSGYLLVFLITRLLLKRLYAVKEKTLISEEWLSKAYVRAFMELVVFRVNRRFGHELRRIEQEAETVTDAHTRIRMVHEFFFASFAIIVLVIKLALIAASVGPVLAGEMSVGVLLALLTLTDRAYQPIAVFNVIYVDYKLNRVTWDRFSAFMALPDDAGLLGGEAFALGRGGLQLEHVSFAYGEVPVLRDISLQVSPGERVTLVGRSGGGKSTLVKLVLGLVKPTSGRVLVDGQDLSRVSLDSYYAHIAYVSQDAPVFDGTLRENICFDAPATEADLMEILDRAQLSALVRGLPQGLHTQVGEHGVKLSGGEKQRLAIARALYFRPAIVILDEPTSALDQETEQWVMEALHTHLRGTTVLSIAHRLSTVRGADRIVVLEGGRIVEEGTHEALLSQAGAYAALYRAAER